MKKIKNSKNSFTEGLAAAWPICMGYIPIGLAFGVLAQKAGLSIIEIGLMSILVFAGSSQFIAVSMISAGTAIIPVILTTFMVNLRHMLMSSSLAVIFSGENRAKLSLLSYGITDESFAVNLTQTNKPGWTLNKAIYVNQIANFTWIISTMLGGLSGQFVPEKAFGIDYALTAMFICLLIFQLKGKKYVFVGIISGILSIILYLLIPGNSYIVIASVLAASIGLFFKKHFNQRRHDK